MATLAMLVLAAGSRAEPGDGLPELPRARVAPDREADGMRLFDITVNNVPSGVLPVLVQDGHIILPPDTARALRLPAPRNGDTGLDPASLTGSQIHVDPAAGTLALELPATAMTDLRIAAGDAPPVTPLSPEIWGFYANYDVNLRQQLEGSGPEQGAGGLLYLHGLGPDLTVNSGWSYDTDRPTNRSGEPTRLDSQLVWRPADQTIAIGLGDAISPGGPVARSYRFGGLSFGTDHSAQPGWTPVPVPTVSGTAQAAGAIDVWINGQRDTRVSTAGGPFSVTLPPGSYLPGTQVVVADVTGRLVQLPFDVPQVFVSLVREGTALWSANIGLPRFDWGSVSNHYLIQPAADATLRYGVTDRMTVRLHAEAASGLLEGEGSVAALLTPRLGMTATMAGSAASGGGGGFASAGFTFAGPWKLTADASAGSGTGGFRDIVAWSGQIYDRAHGIDPVFSEPVRSMLTARLSWQPVQRFSLTTAYQRNAYPGSENLGLISVNASAQLSDRLSLYGSLLQTQGGRGDTTLLFGLSIPLGSDIYGSASVNHQSTGFSGQASANRPLGPLPADIGWNVNASRTGELVYASGETGIRSGYGIPTAGFTWLGSSGQGYARMQGAAGVAAGHAFVSDPVQGALLIADVGQPGVDVLLNGNAVARSGADGKAIVPSALSGTPQRVEIDDHNLPLSAISARTVDTVTVRDGGGGVARFDLTTGERGATVQLLVDGRAPPLGTSLLDPNGRDIPVSKRGTAWVPAIPRDGVLTALLPDGRRCQVATGFDGHGGPGRTLGPLECKEMQR